MLRLNYIFPNGQVVDMKANPDDMFWNAWIDHMVKTNPDVIFFYTVDTTDIW